MMDKAALIFLTPLITQAYQAGEFVMYADFRVEFVHQERRYRLAVPRGFITDFASIPKAIQLLPWFDVNGASRDAAVLHDYLYCCGGAITVRDVETRLIETLELTRVHCDLLLRTGLIQSGVPIYVADLYWEGVHIGGAGHWQARTDGINETDFVPDTYWLTPSDTQEAAS